MCKGVLGPAAVWTGLTAAAGGEERVDRVGAWVAAAAGKERGEWEAWRFAGADARAAVFAATGFACASTQSRRHHSAIGSCDPVIYAASQHEHLHNHKCSVHNVTIHKSVTRTVASCCSFATASCCLSAASSRERSLSSMFASGDIRSLVCSCSTANQTIAIMVAQN